VSAPILYVTRVAGGEWTLGSYVDVNEAAGCVVEEALQAGTALPSPVVVEMVDETLESTVVSVEHDGEESGRIVHHHRRGPSLPGAIIAEADEAMARLAGADRWHALRYDEALRVRREVAESGEGAS
jgi:hypothetical protein